MVFPTRMQEWRGELAATMSKAKCRASRQKPSGPPHTGGKPGATKSKAPASKSGRYRGEMGGPDGQRFRISKTSAHFPGGNHEGGAHVFGLATHLLFGIIGVKVRICLTLGTGQNREGFGVYFSRTKKQTETIQMESFASGVTNI
jgi:hypothetical protein